MDGIDAKTAEAIQKTTEALVQAETAKLALIVVLVMFVFLIVGAIVFNRAVTSASKTENTQANAQNTVWMELIKLSSALLEQNRSQTSKLDEVRVAIDHNTNVDVQLTDLMRTSTQAVGAIGNQLASAADNLNKRLDGDFGNITTNFKSIIDKIDEIPDQVKPIVANELAQTVELLTRLTDKMDTFNTKVELLNASAGDMSSKQKEVSALAQDIAQGQGKILIALTTIEALFKKPDGGEATFLSSVPGAAPMTT